MESKTARVRVEEEISLQNESLVERLRALADEVGQMPAAGVVEASVANNLLGRMVLLVGDSIERASCYSDLVKAAVAQTERVMGQNETLSQQNSQLAALALESCSRSGSIFSA